MREFILKILVSIPWVWLVLALTAGTAIMLTKDERINKKINTVAWIIAISLGAVWFLLIVLFSILGHL